MAELNFTKLADAPILEKVPDGAKVYAEVDGKVYRVAGDNLGGGIKTALFFVPSEQEGAERYYTTCQNMTYDEAKAMLMAGEPFTAILHLAGDSPGFYSPKAIWFEPQTDTIWANMGEFWVWFPDGTFTTNDNYTPT